MRPRGAAQACQCGGHLPEFFADDGRSPVPAPRLRGGGRRRPRRCIPRVALHATLEPAPRRCLSGSRAAPWLRRAVAGRGGAAIAGEGGWDEADDGLSEPWPGPAASADAGARRLLSAKEKHSAVHAAAVKHAAHKAAERGRAISAAPPAAHATASSSRGAQQLAPSGVSLPTIPKRPPVCSVPPAMRFCKNINYPVYRPDEHHTFADLDFDSHAVFKKIVPHMRISERHFELPAIHQVRVE